MDHGEWINDLRRMGACDECLAWAEQYASPEEAWASREGAVWMLWYLARTAVSPDGSAHRAIVRAACDCTRMVMKCVRWGEARPLAALEAAEGWAAGRVSAEAVAVAAAAVYAAACDAAEASAATPSYPTPAFTSAAAHAAVCSAAHATAEAVADVSYACIAVDSAMEAVYYASADTSAHAAARSAYADIVRKHFPRFARNPGRIA